MKMAIIGSGNIGKSIGAWASRAGYEIIFSAKNEEHAREAAKAAGHNAKSASVNSALELADIVLLAVPYQAAKEVLSEAKVVKAFNTVFAGIYASQNSKIKEKTISVFYAGDDKDAKAKVADLITRMGFDAVDSGPLKAARVLEPMALLNIALGYSLGHGT